MRKAVFIDRDRTINKFKHEGTPDDPDSWNYILSWDEFEFLPGAVEGMKLLFDEGLSLFVFSNQSCVGKGLIEYEEMEYIFEKMDAELEKNGVLLDGWLFCPHDPEGDMPCSCRKPKPGMLYTAAFDFDICLAQSWAVGDRTSDGRAAFAAGLAREHIILIGERPSFEAPAKLAGMVELPDLYHAAEYIVGVENIVNPTPKK